MKEALHRRRAHRADDPALPRQLAEHAHRRHLDPALDPGLDHRARARSGQTLNVMTLGGMALAVGILVDDATVEIENIHRNLAQKKPHRARHPRRRRSRSRCRRSSPRSASASSSCRWSSSPARRKSLFVPLAMAVVFAMLTSYFLSRTLVPTLVHYLLAGEAERTRRVTTRTRHAGSSRASSRRSTAASSACATATARCSRWRSQHRARRRRSASPSSSLGSLRALAARRARLLPDRRRRADPAARPRRRRARASRRPSGRFGQIEDDHPQVDPGERDRDDARQHRHRRYSGINLSLSDGALISPADGEILIALKEDHRPDRRLRARAARELPQKFPEHDVLLPPARHLDAGAELRPAGADRRAGGRRDRQRGRNLAVAQKIAERDRARSPARPTCTCARCRGSPSCASTSTAPWRRQVGLTAARRGERPAGLAQLEQPGRAPNYWLDPKHGVQYLVAVQTPQYRHRLHRRARARRRSSDGQRPAPQLLSQPRRQVCAHRRPGEHHPLQRPAAPTTCTPTSRARDLGAVASRRRRAWSTSSSPTLPRGTHRRASRARWRAWTVVVPRPRLRPRLRRRCSSTC